MVYRRLTQLSLGHRTCLMTSTYGVEEYPCLSFIYISLYYVIQGEFRGLTKTFPTPVL